MLVAVGTTAGAAATKTTNQTHGNQTCVGLSTTTTTTTTATIGIGSIDDSYCHSFSVDGRL